MDRRIETIADEAMSVIMRRDNPSFADVLLLADVEIAGDGPQSSGGIPIGSTRETMRKHRRKILYPAHRAMLLRSEIFALMFDSPFREGQIAAPSLPDTGPETSAGSRAETPLQIIPVDCTAEVLEIVLTFLYTESAEFPLDIALDVLHAADMLFIEKLKQRAALLISTLGNGAQGVVEAGRGVGFVDRAEEQPREWVYDVVRSGWDCRVHRLEEFGARYIAYRLETYIEEEDFKELVRESAARIKQRQTTDTVELVDDIRYYLSERFRLRFEDAGLEEMMDGQDQRQDDTVHVEKLEDEGYGGSPIPDSIETTPDTFHDGVIRTLDGEVAGDEFAQDAVNYQILLGKIDTLLDELKLDA